MARAENTELIDAFEEFYRNYYRNEIGELAQQYPTERKSLFVDWGDLYRFDPDLADDYRAHPEEFQEYAEEALRLYDLPVDVKLGQAHVRVHDLPEHTDIRDIRADHRGQLISVQGIVRKATDVRPKITQAAFECQRCGTLTRIPQQSGDFQEPHECQGCDRQGPFRINFDQSEFVDAQKIRVQESPEGLRGGETPQNIDVNIEDDITGEVTAGDHVTVTGVLKLDQQGGDREQSPMFDVYMDGVDVEIEDEQFEEMEITDQDKRKIIALSEEDDLYEKMVGAIAPSIYGYDEEKMAIILQLFSGVTKHLPDDSRIRGDLHILLIGDPGTGKCLDGDTSVTLADGSRTPIRELVESNLDDPKPVDDGVWDTADFEVPSLQSDGTIASRQAKKVWKREAPERMYRIRTARGTEIEVTPSHPLFVQNHEQFTAVRADQLAVGDRLASHYPVETAERTPAIADGGVTSVSVDRITSIERNGSERDWVYDLEVAGTHSYISNGIVSHNSQLLSYVRNIAPRSVYTSGKGSSSAGLCVTGDTLVHTDDGIRAIRDLVTDELPDPVDTETGVEASIEVQTFDRETGEMRADVSSHVWRMPQKSCRRLETRYGKELEASVNTPVLTCGSDGIEWREISEVEPGDHVAVPRFDDIDRSEASVRSFLELTTEKIKLSDESVAFLRESLCDEFGTLRDAAAALDLSEDFIYLHLKNRHVPIGKLDRMLDAVGATREDVQFDRLVLRHGDSITVPETFDEDLMYLLGLVFGDGDISLDRRGDNRGLVRISNSDEQLLRRAADIFDEKFDKRPRIERQEDRVPCIRVNSATIARLFSNAGMETPKADLALAPELTVAAHADAFLRGLMDADGSVSARDSGGSSVLISTISEALADQVQLMLETYGVRATSRERDRRGTYELADGRTLESNHVQQFVEIYGADIDRYAEAVGFESSEKQNALETVVRDERRQREKLPVGSALAAVDGTVGEYYQNVHREDNPGRSRARSMLGDIDPGPTEPLVREAVDADLRWDEVVACVDTGEKEVFDLSVPETHNFVGNGILTHNTAAAVRDDFGDGQQWTLEAGALVLADQGVAAVDELDKMRCVAGETLVHFGDRITRIGDFARQAAQTGTIEELSNGRTIRDVDATAWTMTDDGSLVERPVTAVHEYEAPDELVEVTLESGKTLVSTPDHPFLVSESGARIEKDAVALEATDRVYVPEQSPRAAADGGLLGSNADDSVQPDDVRCENIRHTRTLTEHGFDRVYDLTVEGTHNFVGNGMVVHNSEDRSAMHQALEQQSYHPDTEILLADGRRVAVGEFVDERMATNPDDVVDGVNCEILPVDDIGVHTVDFETNETTKTDVDRVSRHEAPDEFVRVTFSNGRDVLVTPEHPMFVDGGEIVEARDVDEGAFVPAPRKLPNSAEPVVLDDERHVDKEKDVDLPEKLTPALGEALGFLVAGGHSYAGSTHEVGFSNQDERLLGRMEQLMGDVFGLTSSEHATNAGTVTNCWVSTKLYRWFESNFPEVMHTARDKRTPAAVLGASEEVIRRFLVGAFAGDGGVESEAMSFSTASHGLAKDYADALAKIGVASRIHYDSAEHSWKTYVMGDSTEAFVDQVVERARRAVENALSEFEYRTEALEEKCTLRYYRVTDVETVSNEGEHACDWVYDLTVEPTNTFVSQGVVLHNSISISKAGINATLKSRCSLLGAANPKYGRFDQFEAISEQIDLEPALVSRFDLIFTVTDEPDEEKDRNLAEHILTTNYAGELNTHREESNASNYSEAEVANVTDEVDPSVDPELLRKYVAYAKRNCYPTMTEEAREAIQEFYVDLRVQGQDEDAPVPVTARKLEAIVRLAEASARVRLSDTVTEGDAERVIGIVRSCMEAIGVDPETGQLDADMVETGTTKTQRDRIKSIKHLIQDIEDEYDEGAPIDVVVERAEEGGMDASTAEHEIEKLKQKGEVYEPRTDHLRTT